VGTSLTTAFSGTRTINSLLVTTGAAVNLSGGTMTVASGGLLITGTGGTLSNGTLRTGLPAAAGGDLIFTVRGTTYTVSAAIADSLAGGTSLTKAGNGTLKLTAANSYTGNTCVNAGTLSVTSNNCLGDPSGTVVLSTYNVSGTQLSPATLQLSFQMTLATGGVNRAIVVNGSGAIDTGGFNSTIPGPISGNGSFTKSGAGVLTLSGPGSWTGGTTIVADTLRLGAANALPAGTAIGFWAGPLTSMAST